MEAGGRRVFAAAPSSPSPRPSPEQLRKVPAASASRKAQSKSLPGGRAPWRGLGTFRGSLGTACTPLPRGAALPAAMPLPLACCRDGEALAAAAQDGSAAQLIVGVLRATRIPGLHYMCTRPQSRLRRLLWSLAFLASAGLLATGATDRLHHLLSHPVHTRARLTWAPQLRFPAVTLCNPNRARFLRLTKPDLYSVGQWLGLAQENHSLVPEMLAVLEEDQRAWLTRLANYSRFLPPRRSERTMQSFFHRLGHQIEDMLVECRFRGERCGPQHFAPVSCPLSGAGQLGCPMGAGNDASLSDPERAEGWQCREAWISPSKGHARLFPSSSTSTGFERDPWTSSCLQNALPDTCLFPHPRCFLHPQVYTRYGKCYTFNGDRRNPRVTRQGGMGNGLEIMLDIQQEEYLPIWRETSEWGCGTGRAQLRGAGREGSWESRGAQGELWGKQDSGGVLGPRVQVLGGRCRYAAHLPFSRR